MRCGFYETDITPPLGTTIFGYFTKRVNEGTKHKLYAKAAVLEQGDTCVALLAIDSMRMPEGLPEVVKKRVHEKTGIDENAILIAVTHSHTSGPCVKNLGGFRDIQVLAEEPELDAALDHKAMEMTALKAADTVILAYQRLAEVNVRFGIGDVQGISFVRQYYIEDGSIRTNPGYCKDKIVKAYSEPDTELPVFFFTDKDGQPLGIITSFALHHDTVSGSEMSSDYSGVAAQRLKRVYGDQFISVFFSGFCGNINDANYLGEPFSRPVEEYGAVVAQGILETIAAAEPVSVDALDVKLDTIRVQKRELPEGFLDSVKELVKNPPPKSGPMTIADPYSDRMKYAASGNVLARYEKDNNTAYDIPVQIIRIGDCLIYSFIGEVFSQFGDKIRGMSPSGKNMMVEMAHSDLVTCYVPIPELFLPYVYEASYYSAQLVPEAGDLMVEKAIEIAKEIF